MPVKILQREPLSFWERTYLPQILDGLRVTWRNLRRPAVTLEYPDQRPPIPRGFRGAPTLVRDPDGREKCVACQLCEFVCPPKAIRVTPGAIPAGSPNAAIEKQPVRFDLDLLRCIYCGLCQEACPEAAIQLQTEYSITHTSRAAFLRDKARLYASGGTLPDPILKWNRPRDDSGQRPEAGELVCAPHSAPTPDGVLPR
ncbi:MAG: NADH-quinone oxidoreductase subunit I [Puniceicoccales bacterium]|jgi:NADH-quinone oxidoreductase subunit I|nr:NADH-quinone oxidoreductase subunit I [Puniceicoccales bacterium]